MNQEYKNTENKLNFIKNHKNGVLILIRLLPNSSKDTIVGYCDEYIKIKITSQAIENKANKHLVVFLSKHLHIPKNKIEFISGEKSRLKILLVKDITRQAICEKFIIYDRIES